MQLETEIDVTANLTKNIQAGQYFLITKDGRRCVGQANQTKCFEGMNSKGKTDFEVQMFEAEKYGSLDGVTVELKRQFLEDGSILAKQVTSSNGTTTFKDIDYGYYKLVAKKDGYVNKIQNIYLHQPKDTYSASLVTVKTANPNLNYEL